MNHSRIKNYCVLIRVAVVIFRNCKWQYCV